MSVNSPISPCRLTRESYTSYFTLQISNMFLLNTPLTIDYNLYHDKVWLAKFWNFSNLFFSLTLGLPGCAVSSDRHYFIESYPDTTSARRISHGTSRFRHHALGTVSRFTSPCLSSLFLGSVCVLLLSSCSSVELSAQRKCWPERRRTRV